MKQTLNNEQLIDMYVKMNHVRKFEEKVAYLFSMGQVHGTTHLYAGEEAVAIGACAALKNEDIIISTHRGHGHCIGKGIDLNIMMAELLGKADGCCKGKGGSMHIADLSAGNLGANGVVGGGLPLSVGAGMTTKMKNIDRAVVCFFGDGASNQGAFHEALNMASVMKLPVVYICENNLYGMSTPISKSMNITDISVRAAAYGIRGEAVDGNDALAVYEAVKDAVEYVKQNGPMLLVANTYRFFGHSKSDANVYRTKEEIQSWKARCPIKRMARYLVDQNICSREEVEALDARTTADLDAAVAYAEQCPYPELSSVTEDVYA